MSDIAVVEPSRMGDMPLIHPIVGGGGELGPKSLLDETGDELTDELGEVLTTES